MKKSAEYTVPRACGQPGSLPRLALLASIYTLLNVVKPLHVDDTAYYYYAVRAAGHPLDPYGFEIFWYQAPQPANHVLAPPVLPYWWSCAIRLFGDRPIAWKLWLFPFALLFTLALHSLYRRFAPGLAGPLTWMTVLSPTFLPGLNLMLDVPSMALCLGGMMTFFHACDRSSPRLAAVAGLLGGLALETKYNGALGIAAMLLQAALARKVRLGLIASAAAILIFGVWESWTALRYGESHFAYHLHAYKTSLSSEEMLEALARMLGGLAPCTTLFGLIALGLPRSLLVPIAAILTMPYVILAWAPAGVPSPNYLFGLYGLAQYATLLFAVVRRLGRTEDDRTPFIGGERRDTWSLVLWMALEVAGYLVLSPFLAVRRVMGIVVLTTLLAGHLADRAVRSRGSMKMVNGVAVGGIALGMIFYSVDLSDAQAEQWAAERAAAWQPRDGEITNWFVGHWGFQFYAERSGMQPVIPGTSRLHRGDRLVIPSRPVDRQSVQLDPHAIRLVHTLHIRDPIPLRTTPGYYGAESSTFLEHLQGPRLSVRIYEVVADFTP